MSPRRHATILSDRQIAYDSELWPAVRTLVATDPFFGALVFVGVLVETGVVEIADFEDDPDYRSIVDPLTRRPSCPPIET